MIECKFVDKKTGKEIYRNYKYKQLHEIEAIAKASDWLLVRWKREL